MIPTSAKTFEAVVVGAGFAGLYMLYRLRELGLSVRVYEAGTSVGGTWFWNRYPGARCDVESMEYSYSFSKQLQEEWVWTERYASQPEILRYLNYVADRFDLRRDIQCGTRVLSAQFDTNVNRWTIRTDKHESVTARFCIMATGCLSAAKIPEIPGLEDFGGNWFHTGEWPCEQVDLRGQVVGVVGTGSSSIQAIPVIAKQASHLYVFQRTPNFSVPAQNGPIPPKVREEWRLRGAELRKQARSTHFGLLVNEGTKSALAVSAQERECEYEKRWHHGGLGFAGAYADIFVNKDANHTASEFVRHKIRAIVKNPAIAEALLPKGYPLGTKRLCVDSGYYETFNRENVTLVDIRTNPIKRITSAGLQTKSGEYRLDTIIFATGFDAFTGALSKIDILGKNGKPLKDKWQAGPRTYLGLTTAGFPNLFLITGPGSPSVLSNMVSSIEQHVDWIVDCLAHILRHHCATIETTLDAEREWCTYVNAIAESTLFPFANSWYVGANIPGKPRVFMPYVGGVPAYKQRCDDIAAAGYKGFTFYP
jgi:cation diffusion facilitator CzcD-associated flavoprotein CzcO